MARIAPGLDDDDVHAMVPQVVDGELGESGADATPLVVGTTTSDSTEAEQISRLKRYDIRVEEWLASLKEEAGQRSPEVLGALAAKAKDVAEYLDKMAEQARSKRATDDVGSTLPPEDTARSEPCA